MEEEQVYKITKVTKSEEYGLILKDGFTYTSKTPCAGFMIYIPQIKGHIFIPRKAIINIKQGDTTKVDFKGNVVD